MAVENSHCVLETELVGCAAGLTCLGQRENEERQIISRTLLHNCGDGGDRCSIRRLNKGEAILVC